MHKRFLILFVLLAGLHGGVWAQSAIMNLEIVEKGTVPTSWLEHNRNLYGQNKKIPATYEEEILSALSHFPELKQTSIKFRLHSSHATMKTRVSMWSLLNRRDKRKYVITISTRSVSKLEPILFSNLPEEAKVGVLGHELSHVSDFSKKSFFKCVNVGMSHMSQSYVDSLEFNTDKICIMHGLGTELEAWSSFIRNTMGVENWRGSDFVNKPESHVERYMNPSTIEKEMDILGSSPTFH